MRWIEIFLINEKFLFVDEKKSFFMWKIRGWIGVHKIELYRILIGDDLAMSLPAWIPHAFLQATILVVLANAGCPMRPVPTLTTNPRTPGSGGYKIMMNGRNEQYLPDTIYTVSIRGTGYKLHQVWKRKKMVIFLIIEKKNDNKNFSCKNDQLFLWILWINQFYRKN